MPMRGKFVPLLMVILLTVGCGGGEALDNTGSSSNRSLSSSSGSSSWSSSFNRGLGGQPTLNQWVARTDPALITSNAGGLYTEANHPQRSCMTCNGPNQPVIPAANLHRAYARLSGDITTSPRDPPTPMAVSRSAAQARAFDIASAELAEIQRYLGAEEKIKRVSSLKSGA